MFSRPSPFLSASSKVCFTQLQTRQGNVPECGLLLEEGGRAAGQDEDKTSAQGMKLVPSSSGQEAETP